MYETSRFATNSAEDDDRLYILFFMLRLLSPFSFDNSIGAAQFEELKSQIPARLPLLRPRWYYLQDLLIVELLKYCEIF